MFDFFGNDITSDKLGNIFEILEVGTISNYSCFSRFSMTPQMKTNENGDFLDSNGQVITFSQMEMAVFNKNVVKLVSCLCSSINVECLIIY